MADVPVIRIEIDDSAFQQFKETFAKFQEQADSTVDTWKATDDQVAKVRANYEKMLRALEDQSDASEKSSKKTQDTAAAAWAMAKSWSLVHRSARSFGGNVAQSTLQLARWRTLTATFTGLIGAGGLFGINRLATDAAQRRSSALSIGATYGERASFETNFGRLGNTDSIIDGFSTVMAGANKQPLFSLGVDPRGKNVTQVFAEALPLLKKLADNTDPSQMGNIAKSYGLDQLGIDTQFMMRLRNTPTDEVNDLLRANRRDASIMNVPDNIAQRWTDFVATIDRAEAKIAAVLGRNLVNVAPGLTKLSNSVVDLFDELTKRPEVPKALKAAGDMLKSWADTLGKDEVQDKLKKYLHQFDATEADFAKINKWFTTHKDDLKQILGALAGARAGAIFGPAGIAAGAVVGGFVGKRGLIMGEHGRQQQYDRQRAGGAADERQTLEQRNLERKGLGLAPLTQDQFEKERAAPSVQPVAPGDHPTSLPTTNLFGRPVDTADVNPKLLEVTAAAEKYLPPGYHAKIKEGYNAEGHVPGSMHHKKGEGALDIQIYGPDGKAVYDEGDDPTGIYHRYARAVYGETLRRYPEEAERYAWGGQFGASRTNSKQDLMHHDFGGPRGPYRNNNPGRMGPLPEQLKPVAEKKPWAARSGRMKATRPQASQGTPPHVVIQDNSGGAVHVATAPR